MAEDSAVVDYRLFDRESLKMQAYLSLGKRQKVGILRKLLQTSVDFFVKSPGLGRNQPGDPLKAEIWRIGV